MAMKAVSVIPMPKYKLKVAFEDGVSGVVDLKDLVQTTVFAVLKDEQFFNQVSFDRSAIFWSDEMEIDLLNIYMELGNKSFDDLFGNFKYASKTGF